MQFVIIHQDDPSAQVEPNGHPESDVSGFPSRILFAVVAMSFAVSAVIVTMYTAAS